MRTQYGVFATGPEPAAASPMKTWLHGIYDSLADAKAQIKWLEGPVMEQLQLEAMREDLSKSNWDHMRLWIAEKTTYEIRFREIEITPWRDTE